MKNTKGFTLVELVVVIAIIGVLAAILVPTMLLYVRKARLKSANTNAKTAYNAVDEFITTKTAETGASFSSLVAQYGGGNNNAIDCSIPPAQNMTPAMMAVHNVLATNGINSGMVWVDETLINGGDTLYVQWTNEQQIATRGTDAVIGQYPDPIQWDTYKAGNSSWKSYVPG